MLGICANYPHHAFAMDHLALITNFSLLMRGLS